ncbi:MAG: hypothetical protein DSY33_03915 [Archaeoglobus sp.]|nr:MAG: hypothetical protein DSY33_03915 [Archaeoglobus sp.]
MDKVNNFLLSGYFMGVFDLLFNPDNFLRDEVKQNRAIWRGLTVVIVASILTAVNAYITSKPLSRAVYITLMKKNLEVARAASQLVRLSIVFAPLSVIISWIVDSAILFALSSIFGGKGKFRDTVKVVAYSFIPSIVVFPFKCYIAINEAKLVELIGISALQNSVFYTANSILSLAVLAWQFLFWKYGIKNARNLNDKHATIVSAIFTVALLILAILGLLYRSFSVSGGTFK